MTLSNDWRVRIDRWLDAVRARVMTRLGELETEFCPTMAHLSVEEARELSFKPARPGMRWGRKWEYGWFRGRLRVPKPPAGRAVVLTLAAGRPEIESIIFVNGVAAGGLDQFHDHIDLSAVAAAGKEVEVLIETYAGHGPTPGHATFLLPGQQPAEVVPPQLTFGGLRLELWNEAAYQLWMDGLTLRGLGRCVQADSLRQVKLHKGLREVSCAVDPEAGDEAFDASLAAGRKVLAPLLAARNGPTMPEMHVFGHSHIDVAWLWPLAQTYRKNAHTFSTMLALMKRYPEFRFLQSQAQLYDYLRAQYPEIYARIKRAARTGQWIADGGMWVEADTNVSGGEALIRQFLYGKRFFQEEFGVDSQVCWLPDVFGYSAAMPQILRGCGLKYFSTQKIFWNLHGGTDFPYETFVWEGIDGSTVLAHHHRDYNALTGPETVMARWNACVHKDAAEKFLYPFGYGDGGGGPRRDHIEHLRREADLEGMPRTKFSTPAAFFAELEQEGPPADRYVGELYFELHRGTFTSQAKTKRGNRKGELALREAELWSALATAVNGRDYPAAELERTWKKVLLNQFHDILPGSSITRVYEEAEALYEEVLADCAGLIAAAQAGLVEGEEGWTVFNSLSWPRSANVLLPAGTGRPVDAWGNPLDCQVVGSGKDRRIMVNLDVPPMGGASVRIEPGEPEPCPSPVTARAVRGGAVMENELIRLRVNARGELSSVYDKGAGRELLPHGQATNRLELYRDNPANWDAWDVDIAYRQTPVPLGPAEKVEVILAGPLEARVAVRRKIGSSVLQQQIVLRRGSLRVDFETRVDWRERHRLLKAAFPAELTAPTLRGEVQFGHVVRPTHRNTLFERQRFEWPAQKWADLSEAGFGVAVLNDCKYGWDCLDGVLRLSLLRGPVAPDPEGDLGEHEFTYSILPHGPFADGEAVRAAYELNVPVSVFPGQVGKWRTSLLPFVQAPGGGGPTVVIESVKRSEDGAGTVVRLYEAVGGSAAGCVGGQFPFTAADECNMIEQPLRPLRLRRDGTLSLQFRPFEVKTVVLR